MLVWMMWIQFVMVLFYLFLRFLHRAYRCDALFLQFRYRLPITRFFLYRFSEHLEHDVVANIFRELRQLLIQIRARFVVLARSEERGEMFENMFEFL